MIDSYLFHVVKGFFLGPVVKRNKNTIWYTIVHTHYMKAHVIVKTFDGNLVHMEEKNMPRKDFLFLVSINWKSLI